MHYITFVLPRDQEVFQHTLNTEGLNREMLVVTPIAPDEDRVFLLYTWAKEDLIREGEHLDQMIEKARIIKADGVYRVLTNQRQREMYLLHKYQLSKKEAADVIELLKPELGGFFGEPWGKQEKKAAGGTV